MGRQVYWYLKLLEKRPLSHRVLHKILLLTACNKVLALCLLLHPPFSLPPFCFLFFCFSRLAFSCVGCVGRGGSSTRSLLTFCLLECVDCEGFFRSFLLFFCTLLLVIILLSRSAYQHTPQPPPEHHQNTRQNKHNNTKKHKRNQYSQEREEEEENRQQVVQKGSQFVGFFFGCSVAIFISSTVSSLLGSPRDKEERVQDSKGRGTQQTKTKKRYELTTRERTRKGIERRQK